MTEAPSRPPIRKAALGWPPETVWRPLLQRTRDARAEGRLDEGHVACLILLATYRLPPEVRDDVYMQQAAYAQPLTDLVPGARWRTLMWDMPDGWIRGEPSPVLAGGRLYAFGRAAPDGRRGRRRDTLLTLDDSLDVREAVTLGDKTGLAGQFDEVRPFALGAEVHATVVIDDPDSQEWTRAGVVRIADGAYDDLRLLHQRVDYYRSSLAPIDVANGPCLLAWWEPTEVLRYEPERQAFAQASLRPASHVAERFWSGSQGVRVPAGYLFLVNESIVRDDGAEITLCRFALIDDRFQLTAISPQVFLTERGRDVASGLARQGDRLIAGFTSAHGAVLAAMALSPVLATLIPVAPPGR